VKKEGKGGGINSSEKWGGKRDNISGNQLEKQLPSRVKEEKGKKYIKSKVEKKTNGRSQPSGGQL